MGNELTQIKDIVAIKNARKRLNEQCPQDCARNCNVMISFAEMYVDECKKLGIEPDHVITDFAEWSKGMLKLL